MMGEAAQVSAGVVGGHVACLKGQIRSERRGDVPSGDASRENIGDEGNVGNVGNVGESLPRAHIGHVNDPKPASRVGGETALHKVCRA